jgi:steroid 5-alpha reductase family enzyme
MTLGATLGYAALAIFIYMTGFFVLAVVRKKNDIADIAWGMGFIVVDVVTLALNGAVTPRRLAVLALVVIWGVRLAVYITLRNRGKPEDYRYAKWREDWGRSWLIRSYLQVFLLQGLFMWLISLPISIVNANDEGGFGFLAVLGILVWIVGFLFESIGDHQMDVFRSNPANKGQIITTGLWRYTRHPNYFGEVTQWWGVWLVALGAPLGWLGIIGPLTITILLLKVSGVPLLEARTEGRPGWAEYKARTSVFMPWFPRS